MKTLTVLSRKGGSGKTTVAVNLALAARQAGLNVVLADIDPLRSAAEILRPQPETAALLVESAASKLFILQEVCRQNGCDLLILDTPTVPEADIVSALNLSDFCLAVTRPTTLDLAVARQSVALTQRIGCPGLIVLNQCPPARDGEEPALVRQALEDLQFAGMSIAEARLRSRSAYQYALANAGGVEANPSSDAAADVLALFAEISDQLRLRGNTANSNALHEAAPPASPVHGLLDRVSAFASA